MSNYPLIFGISSNQFVLVYLLELPSIFYEGTDLKYLKPLINPLNEVPIYI